MRIETVAVHAGHHPDPATGAVTPSIHTSTTFARDADGNLPHGFLYARSDNPTRRELEASLAALEGGAAALAFASGMAATAAVLQSLAPGDHVIAPLDAYYGTARLLRDIMAGWGLASTLVDMTDPAAVAAAVTPRSRLIWVETPSNPTLAVTDIARIAAIAHTAGARCVCDNTWATPVLQRPLALGADLVMHSTTKYLGGHGDVTGGALVVPEENEDTVRLRSLQQLGGAVPSAFDCWLVMRGIRSLPWRQRAHCAHPAAGAPRRGGVGALSGARGRSGPRGRRAADERFRRDGVGGGAGRGGTSARRGAPRAPVHAGHQPWRPGEPDRASRIGGRSGDADAARTAAAIDRARACGGPDRGSRPGPPRRGYSPLTASA
jgi:O-acetylhomoserine/O-acetylserine sulfhydrylase-like pyridoxal-dependent enzyme